MPCYTRIRVEIEDNAINRKARKNLGLPEEGSLTRTDARRVQKEASILKSMESVRRLDPRAIVRRKGDKVTVTVQR
jgi:hypothetical protein